MEKIRLTEAQLHNVVKNSVKKILNEISWQTANDAYEKSSDANYETYGNALDNLKDALYYLENEEGKTPKLDSFISILRDKMIPFIQAKVDRVDNLQSFSQDKFGSAHDGMSMNDFENSMPEDPKDFTQSQKEYDDYLFKK